MRIVTNPPVPVRSTEPVPADLTLIEQPTHRMGFAVSIIAGMGLALIPVVLLSLEAWLLPRVDTRPYETIPWWIVFPATLVCVLLHELLHLVSHPRWGGSADSLVVFWPQKFQVGVHYQGFMSRSRWLVMRLAPLVGLTLLPTLFLLVVYPFLLDFFWEQFIVLVIVINSLGSGGDLVASVIIARRVPAAGQVGIWNGRAYWRRGLDS